MAQINRSSYELAQSLIRSGAWKLDLDTGVIIGYRGRPIGTPQADGYLLVRPGNIHKVMAHRVVWEFVHGPIPDGMEINHLNGVKTDNSLANLEAVTHLENMRHAVREGLLPLPPNAKKWIPEELRAPRRQPQPGHRPRQPGCGKHGLIGWRLRKSRPGGYCLACVHDYRARRRASRHQEGAL